MLPQASSNGIKRTNAAGLLRPLLTHSLCLVREFQRKVLRSWVERHAGYNLQMGSWVVGLEGDFDFAKDVNYLASVRGRLGWALGSWLPYATAGVAFIDADNNFSVVSADDGPFNFNTGTTDTGFVVGGGVDYKVAPHLSLGLEGLYYDFGSQNTSLNAGDEPFVLKDDENFATVRGRLTYHFDSSY